MGQAACGNHYDIFFKVEMRMKYTKQVLTIPIIGVFLIFNLQGSFAETAIPTPEGKRLASEEKLERGRVVESGFTTSSFGDESIEDLSEILNSVSEVYFFSVLEGMAGQTVTHRWKYGNTVVANAEIPVPSARFRARSSYKMQPQWTGAWFVEVVDEAGAVIATKTFAFMAPL